MDQHETESADFLSIAAADLEQPDAQRLLLHCVTPRPIALTSTVSASGEANLSPFSYFMIGGTNPPSIAISPVNDRSGQPKDTLRNILATGEFVVNAVTHTMRERMNRAGVSYPFGISEWSESGFTPEPSVCVKPCRVHESPFQLECALFEIVNHGHGPYSANYVIGEVVQFHIARALMPDGVIDPTLTDCIGRMGGDWYIHCAGDALFEMPRAERPPRTTGEH